MKHNKIDVNYKNFGKRLFELRTASSYSQEDVVKLVQTSMSLRSYQEYENGHSLPSANVLIGLSKLFNVSIDYLLFNSCENKMRKTWGDKFLSLVDLMADYIIIPIKINEDAKFMDKKITSVFISVNSEINTFLKKYANLNKNLLNKQEYINSSTLFKLAEEQLGKPLRSNREIFPFSLEEYNLAKEHVESINENIEKEYSTKLKRFKN